MSKKGYEKNMRILEGSFRVEGLFLSDEAKNNIALLDKGQVDEDQLVRDIISKYIKKGA